MVFYIIEIKTNLPEKPKSVGLNDCSDVAADMIQYQISSYLLQINYEDTFKDKSRKFISFKWEQDT